MPAIELKHVSKTWGKFYAVDDLSMSIDDHAFVTLLGPSGCGKTTILRMIAGLETPTSGRITIGDTVVFDSDAGINIPANKRKVGFLFQNYALWPNMTVYQNISFGLKNIKEALPRVHAAASEASRMLKALKRPDELSQLVKETVDEKGRVQKNKALLKLIDQYDLSIYTAQKLLDLELEAAADPASAVQSKVQVLEQELREAEKSCQAEGLSFNEQYEYQKNGQPLLEVRRLSKEEIDRTVRQVSRVVKIGMFMDRYPSELSGGQQQRVAIARTLAPKPQVLFMDEPLSNLDAKLRLDMRSELQRLHLQTGATFIYVTHDQLEAMTLASRICLLDNGSLQQYDAPLDIYKRPVNTFVADFVGNPSINFLPARGEQAEDGSFQLTALDQLPLRFIPEKRFELAPLLEDITDKDQVRRQRQEKLKKENPDTLFKVPVARASSQQLEEAAEYDAKDFFLGIRPENIGINDGGSLEAEIYSVMPAGMETTVRLRLGTYLLTAVIFGSILYEIGEKVKLSFKGEESILFSCQNGHALSLGKIEQEA